MVNCSVIGCKSRTEKTEPNITFHRFPREPSFRTKWIECTGRVNWQATVGSRICSRHFETNCFRSSKTPLSKIYLRPRSVPTLFIQIQHEPSLFQPSTSKCESLAFSMETDDCSVSKMRYFDGLQLNDECGKFIMCRICLIKFKRGSLTQDVLQSWPEKWTGRADTIADDIEKITGIKIKPGDPNLICPRCFYKLSDVCRFAHKIRMSHQVLLRHAFAFIHKCHDSETQGPSELDPDLNNLKKQELDILNTDKQEVLQEANKKKRKIHEANKKKLKIQDPIVQEPTADAIDDQTQDQELELLKYTIKQNMIKVRNINELTRQGSYSHESRQAPAIQKINRKQLAKQKRKMQRSKLKKGSKLNIDSNTKEEKKEKKTKEWKFKEFNSQNLSHNDLNISKPLNTQDRTEKPNDPDQNAVPDNREETNIQELWPQPIQLDKNVSNLLIESVQVKQEALSEDEEGIVVDDSGHLVDIKIEPVEFLDTDIQIANCVGSVPFDSSPPRCQYSLLKEIVTPQMKEEPSCTSHNDIQDQHQVVIKQEPSEEDETRREDIPLQCLLCAKALRSQSGLKAHVIAYHSYVSVRRAAPGARPPSARPPGARPPCARPPGARPLRALACRTCKRAFQTKTDLMVHESRHAACSCYGCGRGFPSFPQLARHRPRCRQRSANHELREFIKQEDTCADRTDVMNDTVNEVQVKVEKTDEDDTERERDNADKENTHSDDIMNSSAESTLDSRNQKTGDQKAVTNTETENTMPGETCCDPSIFQCNTNFPPLLAEEIKRQFINLTPIERLKYFTQNILRKRKHVANAKRNSYKYYFPKEDKQVRVCQKFFTRTLGVNIKSVQKRMLRMLKGGLQLPGFKKLSRGGNRPTAKRPTSNPIKPYVLPSYKCRICQKLFADLQTLKLHSELHYTLKKSSANTLKTSGAVFSDSDVKVQGRKGKKSSDSASAMKEEYLDESIFEMCV